MVLRKVARIFQKEFKTQISPPLNTFLAYGGGTVDLTLDARNVYNEHGSHLGICNSHETELQVNHLRLLASPVGSLIDIFHRMEIKPTVTGRERRISGGGGNSELEKYKAGGSSIEYVNYVMTNILAHSLFLGPAK